MNKRTAVALAGGVAGAMVSGVAGYAAHVDVQAGSATAVPSIRPAVQVRTVTTTVRVTKKSGSQLGGAPVRVVRGAGATGSGPPLAQTGGSSAATGSDDEFEGGDD
ncbi:MAG TPA: hypothetical protein VGH10_04740 [Actinomycetota bacterium]|jgi:hypothetical protein